MRSDVVAVVGALAADLVRISSRAGIDDPMLILGFIEDWLLQRSVEPSILYDDDHKPVGLFVKVDGTKTGPALCLDACVDTAPFGDISKWTHAPLSGTICDGILWGRGAADSKIGVAILMELASRFSRAPPQRGTLYFLFDADEHTGCFGGVKAFLRSASPPPQAVILGYPGHDSLIVGARGFLRVEIAVTGESAHSGSVRRRGINAISKLAQLIIQIEKAPLPPSGDDFPIDPSATVTYVRGGEGFSQVPHSAAIGVDIRLTPTFDLSTAEKWLERLVKRTELESPRGGGIHVEVKNHWPAYRVPASDPVVASFRKVGSLVYGDDVSTEVCGPSNIGNYLSGQRIPTICGLGVGYRNLHAADEQACVLDLPEVLRIYEDASRLYLETVEVCASEGPVKSG